MGAIEKIVFVEPKKLEGTDKPVNPFSVGRKNAIIHFPGISEATNALATLHNTEIDGVQVMPNFYTIRNRSRMPPALTVLTTPILCIIARRPTHPLSRARLMSSQVRISFSPGAAKDGGQRAPEEQEQASAPCSR